MAALYALGVPLVCGTSGLILARTCAKLISFREFLIRARYIPLGPNGKEVKSAVCKNLYHVASNEFLGGKQTEREVETLLATCVRANRSSPRFAGGNVSYNRHTPRSDSSKRSCGAHRRYS